MTRIGIDIETTMAHDLIHEAVCVVEDTDEVFVAREAAELFNFLAPYMPDVELVHWNGIGFDIPKLEELWKLDFSVCKQRDGYLLSQLHDPTRARGHSLASYGEELGFPKLDFVDYDEPAEGETVEDWNKRRVDYCIQDVRLTLKAVRHVEKKLDSEHFSEQCRSLEHEVAMICRQQERNGFKLDTTYACSLVQQWQKRLDEIEIEMQQLFPPIVTQRFSDKTGKRLKDEVENFNPGSRPQIARRLQSAGVKLTKFTEKGNPIIDETTLEGIDHPCANTVREYLLLQKRVSQVTSWLDCVKPDGRVHGRVVTIGAITGRMTHNSPNMAQVPNMGAQWGAECRRCWTVDEGNRLVGIDASGLELRMLAHYMKDEAYTQEILKGDVHTYNQRAAGLPTRNDAKTFIYAFIYGAGDAKLGDIAGGSSRKGASLRSSFLQNTPALGKLIDLVKDIARRSNSVPGLDGRRIRVRKEHAALNTLLQGAGAVVMKQALVFFEQALKFHGIPHKIVANVHDEWQVEVAEKHADTVGQLGVQAIVNAGQHLELRCPLDGEYNVGTTWAETH